ncbi:MAG: pyridoxal phosphate-dependent aminotransferase [Pseudomonadota bacterium]
MTNTVSKRVRSIQASATVEINALALSRKAVGEDVISLAAGEPDFDTPAHICEAGIAAIRAGKTHYTQLAGIPELREAIAEKFRRENSLEFDPADVVVANGGKQLIYNAALAVLDPGDNAIVVAPFWVSYLDIVKLADAEPRVVATRSDKQFKLRPADLAAAIDERTRLIYLNSPGNPCGNVYSRTELNALGEVLEAHPQVTIVSDEIYEHLCWGEESSLSIAAIRPALADRTLVVNGMSKCYAMTGWRLGYAGGPSWLMREIRKLQGQQTTNASSIAQYAAVTALNGSLDAVKAMADTYQRRSVVALEAVNAIDGMRCEPVAGAFYLMVDSHRLIEKAGSVDDIALCKAILESTGVACVPGTAFGAPGFIRLSYACEDAVFRDAMARIGEFSASFS